MKATSFSYFLQTHRGFLLVLAAAFFLGKIVAPLGMGILMIAAMVWLFQGKSSYLALLLMFVLLWGDSRTRSLLFFKPMRIALILTCTVHSIRLIAAKKIKFQSIILTTIPFFIIAVLGVFKSPSPVVSFSKMISYFCLLFTALHHFQYEILRKSRPPFLLKVLYLFCSLTFMSVIFRWITPDLTMFGERFRGFLGNPNGFGNFHTLLVPLVAMAWHLYPSTRKTLRYLIFGLIAGLILAQSRTAIGSIMIYLFLLYFYQRGNFMKWFFWLAVMPTLIVFNTLVSIEDIVELLNLEEFFRIESLKSGAGRFLAWEFGWAQIKLNPLIGRGFAYEEIYFHSMRDFFIATEHNGGMHNSFLTFVMNNGLIGAVLFVLFLIILFNQHQAPKRAMPFLIAAIISANFESWLNSSLNAFSILFYLNIVVLIQYPNLKRLARFYR
ncbi:O-antigen ligase family protein [Pontibacter sp. G13]|uniref:O-antigen ligase family protein n=1 Tax=Pontibacter sp. G13 TaxID=3074898 RepID=UPI00288BBE76|nr:O-antigen ligase family protein [Pontibacter sp. G13]WNJ19269.1 O-antigen ligase family protein [Pontibacter sp. G13]